MATSRRILITGTGGRLGRLLFAARDVASDLVSDVVFQSRTPGRDVQWTPGDPFFKLPQCDVLIALWGVTSGSEEELAQNERLVALSLDVARKCGASRAFHLSSAAVYGPGKGMMETTPATPQNAYGFAKLAMEHAVQLNLSDVTQTCLRMANVVGADSLAPVLMEPGVDVVLDRFADGRGPRRSYIGALDVLRVFDGLSRVPDPDMPPVLNVAAVQPVEMEDLARAARKNVIWRPAPTTAVQEVSLDVQQLGRLLPKIQPRNDAASLIAQLQTLEAQL